MKNDVKKEMKKNFLFKFRVNPASIKLDIKFYNYWVLWRIVRHPDVLTSGITNKCDDAISYVTFFDFDNAYFEDVKKQLLAVQRIKKTSHIIILVSSEERNEYGKLVGSYHAYELTKRPFYDITGILRLTSVDVNSLRIPKLFTGKAWVLRTDAKVYARNGKEIKPKPKFKEVLMSPYRTKENQSLAHYLYLREHLGIPFLKGNWDKSSKVQHIEYTTTSKRWKTHWFKVSL